MTRPSVGPPLKDARLKAGHDDAGSCLRWTDRQCSRSLTFRFCATLGDKFGNKIAVFRNIARDNGLRLFERLRAGAQPLFPLADDIDEQFISWLDAGGIATLCRDHHLAQLIDFGSSYHDASNSPES